MYINAGRASSFSVLLANILFLLVVRANVFAGSATDNPNAVLMPPALMLPPQAISNFENEAATGIKQTNFASKDPFEIELLQSIDSIRTELRQTNLNSTARLSLEHILTMAQIRLSNHEDQIQQRSKFDKLAQQSKDYFITNPPDPLGQALAADIAAFKTELADTNLNPVRRKTLGAILADYNEKLEDHKTNVNLWNNLTSAQLNRNPEQIVNAKQQLADYLAVKLGQMQGKTYPKGMAYDTVIEQY